MGSHTLTPGAWMVAKVAEAHPMVTSSNWSRPIAGGVTSWTRLGGTACRPAAMSWIKAAQPDRLSS